MFNKIKRSFSARVSFYVLLIVFLIFTITIITVTVYTYVEAKKQASEYAMQLLNNNNLEFEKTMGRIEKVPDNLKVYITKQKVPANVLYDITKEVIKNNPDIYGCAIAFEPNYYPEQGYYFAPYSWRNGDSINTRQLGNNDYDYFSMDWYQIPKLLNKNYWSEPYYDDGGGQKVMSTYSSLLYDPKGDFIGIFTADIDISWINKLAAQLKPYEHAATYIIGRSGTFIVHPDSSCVLNESIFSKSLMAGDKKSYKIGQKMMDGESGDDYLIIEGKPYYIFYKSIPSFEWSIAILCPMSEVYAKANTARRTLFLIGFIGLIIIVLVIFFVVKKMTQPFKVFSESAKEIAHGNFETPLPEITSQDEMLDMRNSFEYMQKELRDYIKDLQTTTQAKEKIENELHIAHEIQMSMIPKIFPPFPKRKDIDLYATLTPAKEVGGDLYDFFLKDNKLFFAIGDVSGKGVPASLVMAITKSLVHTLAFQTNSLKNLIEAVNNAISENNSANMFVTFFIGILNLEDGHVSYCNAGHNPPLLISPTGKVSPINVTPNIPLGLFEGFEYVEESIDIKKGSKILLFTDGVTEAENKAKELYDDKRLQGCTITHAHLSAKGLIESIMDDVKDHVKDAPQSDDLTMLVLHYCQED